MLISCINHPLGQRNYKDRNRVNIQRSTDTIWQGRKAARCKKTGRGVQGCEGSGRDAGSRVTFNKVASASWRLSLLEILKIELLVLPCSHLPALPTPSPPHFSLFWWSSCVAPAGLEFLGSSDLPASASWEGKRATAPHRSHFFLLSSLPPPLRLGIIR